MKINFLTSTLSDLTGGAIYDLILYKKLRARFGDILELFDDKYFLPEGENKNFLGFSEIYRKNVWKLFDCDYLIMNSRLYTRFIGFPWGQLKKVNCKLVAIHHHFNYQTHTGYKSIVHKKLEMKLLNHADIIITPNPYVIKQLEELGLKNKSIMIESYLSNNINCTDKERKKQILFVGTIEPRKGIVFGIQAFYEFWKGHKDYKYLIAGKMDKNDSYYQKLQRMVTELQIADNVIFLGRISEEEKKELYSNSKVFLFPSQNEGYGWVLVEAMSYGIPVVAFDNSAMPYTVNNNNGALVENRNTHEMSIRLSQIIDDPALYKRLVAGAYETVQALPNIEDIEAEYENFFELIENQ